jgi:hypothetical protein
MLAMVVNVNAGNLAPRGVLGFIASMLAPTEGSGRSVDQSMLARDVNDYGVSMAPHGALGFIASADTLAAAAISMATVSNLHDAYGAGGNGPEIAHFFDSTVIHIPHRQGLKVRAVDDG